MNTAHAISNDPVTAAEVVNEFLRLIMLPDPVAASQYTAPDMRILFTGGRAMRQPADCTQFNASRYQWVKKRIERTETVASGDSAPAASAAMPGRYDSVEK